MLFMLFLFIVPSAVGLYCLLKPPQDEWASEREIQSTKKVLKPFKGIDDMPSPATNASTIIGEQT